MITPTKDEVTKEVAKLREQVKTVRKFSAFGDDNQASIEAQIRVAEEDFDEEHIEDFIGADEQDDALYMRYWLDGKENVSPSENWAALC